MDLLDLERVPALRTCEVVVELHEHERRGCTEVIVGRFRETHEIEIIAVEERDPAAVEAMLVSAGAAEDVLAWWRGLTEDERREAVNEQRPAGMSWAHMAPRAGAGEVGRVDSGQGAVGSGQRRKPRAGKMPSVPGPEAPASPDVVAPEPPRAVTKGTRRVVSIRGSEAPTQPPTAAFEQSTIRRPPGCPGGLRSLSRD